MSIKLSDHLKCPLCKSKLNGAKHPDNPDEPIMPKEDDIAVCAYCCSVLIFVGEPLSGFRLAEEDEIDKIRKDDPYLINQVDRIRRIVGASINYRQKRYN